MIGVVSCLRILTQDFRIVLDHGTLGFVALMPGPIEHEHLLVLFRAVVASYCASQGIGSSPLVAADHLLRCNAQATGGQPNG